MDKPEEFWGGSAGNEYNARNANPRVGGIESNQAMFARILRRVDIPPESVLELGAGRGNALRALRRLLPRARLSGVELGRQAFAELVRDFPESVCADAAQAMTAMQIVDMTLTKGFLIHVPPESLDGVYAALYYQSKRYILLCEYYEPKPTEIVYRGQTGLLWKRDFAGEMLDRFEGLHLVDTGWVYHRSPHPQDDLTWFLMEKR